MKKTALLQFFFILWIVNRKTKKAAMNGFFNEVGTSSDNWSYEYEGNI